MKFLAVIGLKGISFSARLRFTQIYTNIKTLIEMEKLKKFLITTLIGGLLVILPVAILAALFNWIFKSATNIIQPLTNIILAKSDVKEFLADVIAVFVILACCFLIGLFVRTRFGKFFHNFIEDRVLKIAPGYNLIKETILQILGNKNSPFSKVALVQLFGNETLATAFVTDEHNDGSFTVFIPTGPNPTSGNIYHLKTQYVHPVDIPVEEAMRSIISCGAGSSELIEAYQKQL